MIMCVETLRDWITGLDCSKMLKSLIYLHRRYGVRAVAQDRLHDYTAL